MVVGVLLLSTSVLFSYQHEPVSFLGVDGFLFFSNFTTTALGCLFYKSEEE